jgi:hypothetical protein
VVRHTTLGRAVSEDSRPTVIERRRRWHHSTDRAGRL